MMSLNVSLNAGLLQAKCGEVAGIDCQTIGEPYGEKEKRLNGSQQTYLA
jgi:hypothetical protein